MDRETLQSELEQSRQRLLTLIEDLPDSAFTESGVMADWSLKDILAHISRWEGLCVTMLWKLKQGQHAERFDIQGQDRIDQLNAKWHQEDKDRPLELVMADFKGLRKQTIRRLQQFQDSELENADVFDELRGEPLWKWVAVDTFEHEQEHLTAIKRWLDNRG